ncbi:MAG TPA: hypothetical protein VHP38_12080 [Ruminiclostridium sp.]|nr:hypothetical protein [Ruminiclostridium sp.]
MIKTNKFKPVIKIPAKLVRKINTSFAQNILGKYGIGRWKSQFLRLIFRNSSDIAIISGGEKESRSYTQIYKYNSYLKLYKYISTPLFQTKKSVNKHIFIPGPTPGYTRTDSHLNSAAHTEIIQRYYTKTADARQTVILKQHQTKQHFHLTNTVKTVSLFNSISNNVGKSIGTVTNNITQGGEYSYHTPELPNKRSADYKQGEIFSGTFPQAQIIDRSLKKIFKNELVREERFEYLLKRYLSGELKLNKAQKPHEMQKFNVVQRLDIIQKLNAMQKLNAAPTLSGADITYSSQERVFQRGIRRGEENKINTDAAEGFVHFLPGKHNGLKDKDLVFYMPQSKEKKMPEIKEERHKDIITGDRDVYAKAITPSKPDKKLQSAGTEEVNMLAEKVFKIIEKRLAIQKDRRGLR